MKQHFVTFLSPGTFVAEDTTKPIDSWDVEQAKAMAAEITERHGARPYGFRFTTRGREEHELDSKVIATSPMYFLKGRVRTAEEVLAGTDPKEEILRWNVGANNINRVFQTVEGWLTIQPLNDDDIVLEVVE